MIHYHGTPLSGAKVKAGEFFQGRHALVSYAHREDLEIVAECCQSFVLDNGAFSVWRKGGSMDVDGYIEWCLQWYRHPGFDWALIPDVIDGTTEENTAMLELWPDDINGVPIWHFNEHIDYLKFLANDYKCVAFGSAGDYATVGDDKWWKRATEALNAITINGKPVCKIHGLRMLNPRIFSHIPFSSADSTNAAQNAGSIGRFGSYVPPLNKK